MKKTFVKAAAAIGLCVSVLAVSIPASAAGLDQTGTWIPNQQRPGFQQVQLQNRMQNPMQNQMLGQMDGRMVISEPGAYTLTGDMRGTVYVDPGQGDVKLILDGANIDGADGPAIMGMSGDRLDIELRNGTINGVNGGPGSDFGGAVYSQIPVNFQGGGQLNLSSGGPDAIRVDQGALSFNGGDIRIQAGQNGLNAPNVNFNGGTVAMDAASADFAPGAHVNMNGGQFTDAQFLGQINSFGQQGNNFGAPSGMQNGPFGQQSSGFGAPTDMQNAPFGQQNGGFGAPTDMQNGPFGQQNGGSGAPTDMQNGPFGQQNGSFGAPTGMQNGPFGQQNGSFGAPTDMQNGPFGQQDSGSGAPSGMQNGPFGQQNSNSGAPTDMQQPGAQMNGQQFPGAQQNGGIQSSTNTAGAVVTGTTSNSAMDLTADYDSATTYDVSENSTVKISDSGTYVVTGTSSDGSITVKKETTGVVLVLKDLDLTSTSGATLSINKNAEVQVIVSGNVTLTDNENPADEYSTDADVADAYDGAAIKVKAGSVAFITGDGKLTVNGNAKNGIKAGDDSSLIIGGDVTVDINAANDGINGNYDVSILSGDVTVSAGDDGIHADHILTIGENGKGPNLTIRNATEGMEGTVVNIGGGRINVNATDDGINAANADGVYEGELGYSVNITGGDVTVNTEADGVDSNGNVNLIGGSMEIRSASNGGDAGIDYDGDLYVSDSFSLNNGSGVAGPDMMPGQMGGMPGQMGGGMNGQMGGMPGQMGGSMGGQMGGGFQPRR